MALLRSRLGDRPLREVLPRAPDPVGGPLGGKAAPPRVELPSPTKGTSCPSVAVGSRLSSRARACAGSPSPAGRSSGPPTRPRAFRRVRGGGVYPHTSLRVARARDLTGSRERHPKRSFRPALTRPVHRRRISSLGMGRRLAAVAVVSRSIVALLIVCYVAEYLMLSRPPSVRSRRRATRTAEPDAPDGRRARRQLLAADVGLVPRRRTQRAPGSTAPCGPCPRTRSCM